MKPAQTVLDTIGHTPLVKINGFDTGLCELYIKLECNNPFGSIKDRIAKSIIYSAESQGLLKPGQGLIEASAGNTGISLTAIAKLKGYPMTVVIPDKMSQEKINQLELMGASVITTRSDVSRGDPAYYLDMAENLARELGLYYTRQFSNPANIQAHYTGTGPEIWEQTAGEIDAFICGVGSGGTLSGVGGYLKERKKNIDIILADPKGSLLANKVNKTQPGELGSWLVEGIGEDFVPDNCDLSLATRAFSISDREAFYYTREFFQREQILAGTSTGVLLAAALHYCKNQPARKKVVTLACDTGYRYLSKAFNNKWLEKNDLYPSA